MKVKKTRILDLFCDEKISDESYKQKTNEVEFDILKSEKALKDISELDNQILVDSKKMLQLLLTLSDKRKTADYVRKGIILKTIMFQLFVDNKKQLFYQENELFEIIKFLNLHYGGTISRDYRTLREILDEIDL